MSVAWIAEVQHLYQSLLSDRATQDSKATYFIHTTMKNRASVNVFGDCLGDPFHINHGIIRVARLSNKEEARYIGNSC
jgi:hypothetical protein